MQVLEKQVPTWQYSHSPVSHNPALLGEATEALITVQWVPGCAALSGGLIPHGQVAEVQQEHAKERTRLQAEKEKTGGVVVEAHECRVCLVYGGAWVQRALSDSLFHHV